MIGYLKLLGLVVSGAGTMASILGIFFAVYTKQNGRMAREFIHKMHQNTQRLIQALIKEMRDEFNEGIAKMDEHLVRMDEHNNERHKEMMALLARVAR
jgi:flagellar motor component MotA